MKQTFFPPILNSQGQKQSRWTITFKLKLLVKKVNGPRYYKSVYNRAVNAWNKLDTKYTTIMVKQSFKAVMKRLYGNIYTDDSPNYIRI